MKAVLALVLLPLLAAGEIVEVRDAAYVEGDAAHPRKHKLDLFLPKGRKGFPTIVFIHGGGWHKGDRSLFGALGRRFAEDGVAMAVIGYRLAPQTKHPGQVEDCARAFAWVHANIAVHGGDPERLFLMGHSAGGHLSALLSLDPKYLEAVKVPGGTLKGAIPLSGVYVVPALPPETRGIGKAVVDAFGSDAEVCRDASPVTHVNKVSCPFLVLTETNDTLNLRPSMGLLKAAMTTGGVKGFTFEDAEGRDHVSIIGRMMTLGADPYRNRITAWVRARCQALDEGE